jgi:hypothetical protein
MRGQSYNYQEQEKSMRVVIASLEAEYRRYKRMAEAAFAQLSEDRLVQAHAATDNSVATIAWHVPGICARASPIFWKATAKIPGAIERRNSFRAA